MAAHCRLLLLPLLLLPTPAAGSGVPTVVVIGGGIGGASTALFLREALDGPLGCPDGRIVVVEKDRIGGRMRREPFAGVTTPELGAAVWHSSHKLMSKFADLVQVERAPAYDAGHFVLWNGREVAFEQRPGTGALTNTAEMLWRYGLSPLYAQRAVGEIRDRLSWAYSVLSDTDANPPFQRPEDFLRSVGVHDLYSQTLRAHLRERGFSAAFMDELVEGVTRNNYGQPVAEINALAGLASLLGGGSGGELRGAKGGNERIAEGLLRLARAEVWNATVVTAVRRQSTTGPARLYFVSRGDEGSVAADIVFVAAPLDTAEIAMEMEGLEWTEAANPARYQTMHTTIVAADRLSRKYFHRLGAEDDPAFVMTMEEAIADFLSVGRTEVRTEWGQRVYRVLSRKRLADETVDGIFHNRTGEVKRHAWKAYPKLEPNAPLAPTRIAPRVYHTGGLEAALPGLETAAMGARNAVNLFKVDWKDGLAEAVRRSPAAATADITDDEPPAAAQEQEQAAPEGDGDGNNAATEWLSAALKYTGGWFGQGEEEAAADESGPEPASEAPSAAAPEAGDAGAEPEEGQSAWEWLSGWVEPEADEPASEGAEQQPEPPPEAGADAPTEEQPEADAGTAPASDDAEQPAAAAEDAAESSWTAGWFSSQTADAGPPDEG